MPVSVILGGMFSRSPYRDLERRLGHRFRNRKLLELALTHRSFRHETHGVEEDNQRLEFLGDAALCAASAAWLYRTCPDLDEGRLTHRRSGLTAGPALSAAGLALDMGSHIRLGRGEEASGGMHRARLLEDCMEAVAGAIYLDAGPAAFQRWFERRFAPLLATALKQSGEENSKGALQEFCQRRGLGTPDYAVEAEEGELHARRFRVAVCLNGSVEGRGEGRTKKTAEQGAAREALARLRARAAEAEPESQRRAGTETDSMSTGSGAALR